MMHSAHDDIHDIGLVDGCEECAYKARNPFATLDNDMLAKLVARTVQHRFGGDESPFGPKLTPRSDNEAAAMRYVLDAMEQAGQLAEKVPDPLALYLRERWHVTTSFDRGGVTMLRQVADEVQRLLNKARIRDVQTIRGYRRAVAFAAHAPAMVNELTSYPAVTVDEHTVWLTRKLDELKRLARDDWDALLGVDREDVWRDIEAAYKVEEDR